MSGEPFTCPDCGIEIETEDDVEADEPIPVVEFERREPGPPRVVLGTDQRNLYRCRACGKVLGVN